MPNAQLTAAAPTGVGTPALTNPGNQSSTEGNSISLQVQAAGPDNVPLAYSATGLPGGVSLNASTGMVTGSIAAGDGQANPYSVVVSALNGSALATQSFAWTITQAISIAAVANQSNTEGDSVSLQLSASDALSGVTLTYSASGLPAGLSINSSAGLIAGIVLDGAATAGPYNAEVDVGDGTYYASISINWSVAPSPIQFPLLPQQTNNAGDTVSLPVPVFDPDSGATLTFSASNLPTGLSINSTSGLISGTIALGDGNNGGTYTPTVTVSDGTNQNSETLNWLINSPVSLSLIAAQTNSEGDTVSLPVSASDATSGVTLTYSASGLPSGLSINASSGLISGTLTLGDGNNGGTYTPTVTASDGTSSAREVLFWQVSSAISISRTSGQTNTEGDSVSLSISATDATSGVTLTYSASGLPTGLSVNASSGLISGTLALGDGNGGVPAGTLGLGTGSTYAPTISVSDGTSSNSEILNWFVTSAVSFSQASAQTSVQTNTEGDTVSLQVSASDATSGATLTYSASGLPPGLGINAGSGLILGTVALGDANNGGTYAATISASDGASSSSEVINWSILSAIKLAPTPSQTNTEGDSVSVSISATDATSGTTLTYSASGLPSGLGINASTGLISGTIALGDANNGGTYAPSITVTDGTSTNSESFPWQINSAIRIIQTQPQSNREGNTVAVPVNASDATPGVTLTYSAVGLPIGLAINASTGVISGTVALGAGNAGTYAPTISVTDGTSSASETLAWSVRSAISLKQTTDQISTEGASVSLSITATDATSGVTLTYSASGLPAGLSINASSGLISGTISLGDANNGGTYTPSVTVTDGTSWLSEEFNWSVSSAQHQDVGRQLLWSPAVSLGREDLPDVSLQNLVQGLLTGPAELAIDQGAKEAGRFRGVQFLHQPAHGVAVGVDQADVTAPLGLVPDVGHLLGSELLDPRLAVCGPIWVQPAQVFHVFGPACPTAGSIALIALDPARRGKEQAFLTPGLSALGGQMRGRPAFHQEGKHANGWPD